MKVFISYRRNDFSGHASAVVGRIYDRLSDRLGEENIFMDIDTIPPGVDFVDYLSNSVAQADILLAVVGPEWVEHLRKRSDDSDDFVRIEVESALEGSVPVVPLLVAGTPMPRANELPESLSAFVRRNAFHLSTGRDFKVHMERLVEDLERLQEFRATQERNASKASKCELRIIDPPPYSPLPGDAVDFSWSIEGATPSSIIFEVQKENPDDYFFRTTPLPGNTTSYKAMGIPTDGEPIFARVWWWNSDGESWISSDYVPYTSLTREKPSLHKVIPLHAKPRNEQAHKETSPVPLKKETVRITLRSRAKK